MLEGLASWVLKTYIGKYVNVNAQKLSVGLLSGLVELENVPFLTDAFNENDLPFELKFGYIGKIKLKISLNALRYTPLILTVENAFLILGPKRNLSQTSLDKPELFSEKLEKLNNLENKWFKEVEFLGISNSTTQDEQSKLVSIFGPMAYSLLQNIHFNLNHLHVRYEDDANKFSIGVYLDSISIQNSPDENNKNFSFKSCELNNFSIYTDTNTIHRGDLELEQMFNSMFIEKITDIELNPAFLYIVEPSSLKAQIIRDLLAQPLRKSNKPRIKIQSDIKQFHLNLNLKQLDYLFELVKTVNIYGNRLASRHLVKPDPLGVELDADKRKVLIKEWWKYSLKCVQTKIRRPTMSELIKWSKDVNLYRRIYMNSLRKRLTNVDTNQELESEQQRIETEWSFERLVKLRRLLFKTFIKSPTFKDYLVKVKLKLESSKTSEDAANYLGVYGYVSWRLTSLKEYYFSQSPSEQHKEEIKQDQTSEYNKIDDEVVSLINDSLENNSILRRDTLLARFEFKLDDTCILLSSSREAPLAELQFGNSTFLFEMLPRHDSYLFQMSLGTFYLHDCVSSRADRINQFSTLVYPKNSIASTSVEPVFQLAYELNPFQMNQNKKKFHGAILEVQSCGLDIVYNAGFIKAFVEWFDHTRERFKHADSVKIKPVKYEEFEEIILDTKDDKINLISSSPIKNLILNLEINGPMFLFPQDFYSSNPLVVVFDFGRFVFKNRDIQSYKSDKQDLLMNNTNNGNFISIDYEDDEEDVYETPSSTPPPQLESVFLENLIETNSNPLEKFYITYDLHMNSLQTLVCNLRSENIKQLLAKGHSSFHFLDKFDIHIQVDLCKYKLKHYNNVQASSELTPLKINIGINLLKINLDDLKLVSLFKTLESFQKLIHSRTSQSRRVKVKNEPTAANQNVPLELNADPKEFESTLLNYVSVNLDEIDITMSVNKFKEPDNTDDELMLTSMLQDILQERISLCELKIYNINSELMSNMNGNKLLKFKIVGLLLIDARQIFGVDYQLLAASHNQVELDSRTGRIMERLNSATVSPTRARKFIHEFEPNKPGIHPLINIDLIVRNNNKNCKEYILKSSFSTFDIILNPETISEIITMFYSSYLSISSSREESNEVQNEIVETLKSNEIVNSRLRINFEFSRLSVLMFKIENFERAQKIALFSLNGTSLEATILPEINYMKSTARVKGLKISNLRETLKISANQKSLFGIGLQNDLEFNNVTDDVVEIVYNKSVENLSELKIKMASLCYLHSPEFIYDLQCCCKDFMRFHVKTMETLTEKAASVALDIVKKGTTYLENTIADIYQKEKQLTQKSNIKLKILLQTPVIAIPMNNESDLLLIGHLGHITINNNVANNELNDKFSMDANISDSTKFEVNLKSVRFFTIDLAKEKNYLKQEYERFKGFKSEIHKRVFVIENFFQIYYEPKCAAKLIDETDVYLSLDYLPKFSTNSISGGYIRALSKINFCKLSLSKTQLEQMIKTLDNIVYDESHELKQTTSGRSQLKYSPKSPGITFNPARLNTQNETNESLSKLTLSSFKTLYNKFSELNDELKSELVLNVKFKIDKLQINFLADVEQPGQDVAELCFNEYELTISKHEKHVKFIKMTLNSLSLIDNLRKMKSDEMQHHDEKNIYLLKSFSSLTSADLKHTCNRKASEYLSNSLPNLACSVVARSKQFNLDLFNYCEKLSTSLCEIPKICSETSDVAKDEEEERGIAGAEERSASPGCPCTPPPSPTKQSTKHLARSESASILDQEDSIRDSSKKKSKKCLGCLQQTMPLVSIKLIFIDKNHPKFDTKYFHINRYYKIKFSDLQLNVNPETWIILLDMLGLGSKIYSLDVEKEESSPILNQQFNKYHFVDKMHPFKEEENLEEKPHTSIEFEVKNFAIQLNKSVSSAQFSQIRVKNVMTYIEARPEFMNVKGTLGRLEIYDISPYRGLYSDRFLTSGRQALEFEFLKMGGPPDIMCTREYDNWFKLRMSSVKYVHTQRFLSEFTNYFQQFNQLQDSLGRMRALSIGQKNISCIPQRSSRVKLDIQAETPIIVLPVNTRSSDALVLNLGNIKVENRFIRAEQEGTFAHDLLKNQQKDESSLSSSLEKKNEKTSYCLLDIISVQFTDTNVYSAIRFKKNQYEIDEKPDDKSTPNGSAQLQVDFNNFLFKQHSGYVLEKKSYLHLHLERNLENELSHSSPDWQIHAKLSSFLFSLDLKQYMLIRGILDQNLGEKLTENSQPTFMVPNTLIETVLTGEVWKVICINLDLENVSIELLNHHEISELSTKLKKSPIAILSFLKSSLIYESYSDQSKLIDLVSSEIQVIDCDKETRRYNKNIFTNILCNPKQNKKSEAANKRLQLELHYRSNKTSNRYSVLINNCRVISVFDWLLKLKNFLSANYDRDTLVEANNQKQLANNQQQQHPIEIKLNLTNTDIVLVENTNDLNSQAVILRLTAFIEFNQRKLTRPFEACLQSVELFSCQMNAIEQTALSIIDPVTFSINLTAKSNTSGEEEDYLIGEKEKLPENNEFILDISTDKLKMRFSYLDFKLFIRLMDSINKQIQSSKLSSNEANKQDAATSSLSIHSIELGMDNFCICIIDDCKDVDIPLTDIQFNHLKLVHLTRSNPKEDQTRHGSAEFGLNVDYYNRLLSGWEPLVEPWLARINWKLKTTKNCFTLTSIDNLNINLTNSFLDLMTSVLMNWKSEYNVKSHLSSKRHKIFQPYKLINLTGEKLKFCTYKDTNTIALEQQQQKNQELDLISSKWMLIDDKCEKQFNFYDTNLSSKTMHSNHHYAQRSHNYQLRELVQHRIRVKLDDWSEIKPLTIDKVGRFFRDMMSESKNVSNSVTRLIFEISLSGNATKMIRIKSPLSVKNRLNYKIQCRIEPYFQRTLTRLGPLIVEIDRNAEISVPIKYLPCNIWFRPLELGINKEAEFSSKHANCNDINQSGQVEYFQMSCKITCSSENFIKPATNSLHSILGCELFYFFVRIKRLTFPNRSNYEHRHTLPSHIDGHVISIEPAFTLHNLLPIEFRYKFISTSSLVETNLTSNKSTPSNLPVKQKKIESVINGKLDANKNNHFSNINVSNPTDLLLDIDNFRMAKAIEIHAGKHLSNLSRSESSTSSKEAADLAPNLTLLRRVNFYDEKNRPLFLIARIIFKTGSGLIDRAKTNDLSSLSFTPCPIEVHISAVYCFFNLTGLPLLFRQYNCDESAGQLEEHEMARSNQPLLFSFNETDSPYACSMRIGKYCNDFKSYFYNFNKKKTKATVTKTEAIIPKWCKPFGLEGGSSYRALHVVNNTTNNGAANSSETSYLHPDWVYYIGIEIKKGKGLLRDTTFVYFSTRFYLVNKSSQNLLVSQYFSIQNLREQNANTLWDSLNDKISISQESSKSSMGSSESDTNSSTSSEETDNCIALLNDSMTQFHWPRTDKDQLLAVRLKSNSNYNWSGGFKIDNVDSFYLNMRHKFKSNEFFFVKVEVILDGGTFFIVFTDTDDFPPPITVHNLSEIPVYFYQSQSVEEKYSITVKPKQSLNYSWDEPILEKKLTFGVNGGTTECLDFSLLEDKKHLYYDNFIYVVFSDESTANLKKELNLNLSDYVLTASDNKVYIELKESGNRAQLWTLTSEGYLIHEGSSPPRELNHASLDLTNCYVLDIDDVAPRPNYYTSLILRRPDTRRNNTQKWMFLKNGLLCCIVPNMCVQIQGDFKRKSSVVLGPAKQLANGFLKVQIAKERLRPGSGHLKVEMLTDGPTRLLKITNVSEKAYSSINWKSSDEDETITKKKSLETYINLSAGIGISLVHWYNQEYEELLYGCLKSLEIAFDQDETSQKLMLNVQSIQVCNQLVDGTKHNLLHIHNSQNFFINDAYPLPHSSHSANNQAVVVAKKLQPALHIDLLRLFKYDNIITIKHLIFKLLDVNLQVEEKLLWKLIQMFGVDKLNSSTSDLYTNNSNQVSKTTSNHLENKLDNDSIDSDLISLNYYKNRINSLISYAKAIKFSFNKLQIDRINMTLSVYKTSKLNPDLTKIKSSLGIPLIQFENARIDLKAFLLMNEHDTASCILNLIKKHYEQALKENAIRILGSVDFLGNPLGFVVDFKESLTNVLSNGQVTDFVFSVTNSVANSVSKFSGFLSDELNELTLDERHRETRDQIRTLYSNGGIDHFVGGALGFAVGIVGGALSLATQTYRGFYENGVSGAFAGFGKGAVGTVSKPIVGMLDFTNGIASAIRETSKTSYKMEASRARETRCCYTAGSLLTPFSTSDAEGQKILYQVNGLNLSEKFISMEQLNSHGETTISIITNLRVIIIKREENEYTPDDQVTYGDLKSGKVVEEDGNKIFLEILLENEDNEFKTKKIRLENKQIAHSFANKIRFAKADFDEMFYSLPNFRDQDE